MRQKLVVCFFSIWMLNAEASILSEKLGFLRQWVAQTLGEKWANKLWGEKEEIKLPTIPALKSDARSIAIYSKQKRKTSQFEKLSDKEKERYNYYLVKELMFAVRDYVGVDDQEISNMVNILNQGASREGVYRKLILDNYYLNLEHNNEVASEKLVEFVMEFMDKYLNLEIKKEILLTTNHFIVKRICVEKALEIMDRFENFEQLSDWYAVVSADYAVRFDKLFKGKLRLYRSRKDHKLWAMKVPTQHLKSEIIIKLHKIMNFLKK